MAAAVRNALGDEFRADSPPAPDAAAGPTPAPAPAPPTDAMRARAERNLMRARSLRRQRAASCPDTGGGFLPERAEPGPARAPHPPAPLADPAERPRCLLCGRGIALSYLLDAFQHAVCDDCRDADGEHALLTRTEAKAEYLLQDCDLDARGGALACVRRRNPHAARGDMRLYLRAQLQARAHEVWGGAAQLAAARAQREQARERAGARREARRLRALRMDVRSSLFRAPRAAHAHAFSPETYDAAADLYSRACACGHTETYEKM